MYMPKELGIYPSIIQFYGKYIPKKGIHPLENCLKNPLTLSEIDSCLEILSPNSTLDGWIKKTKNNPGKFCDFFSELTMASYLSDRVDKLKFVQSGRKAKPDLEIHLGELRISCEVKRIGDKFADKPKDIVHIIDDITTVRTAFEKSVKKGQYFPGVPHIFYFDCPSLSEGEIIDVFYPIKGPVNSITLEINHKLVHPSIPYSGYFQQKNPSMEYIYSMVSGVACKFFTGKNVPQISEIVYFPNPNAVKKIPEKIIQDLGFVMSRELLEYP